MVESQSGQLQHHDEKNKGQSGSILRKSEFYTKGRRIPRRTGRPSKKIPPWGKIEKV